MIGSSLELWAIYGWIISLLEAIIITDILYLANVANASFPESIVFDQDQQGYWERDK